MKFLPLYIARTYPSESIAARILVADYCCFPLVSSYSKGTVKSFCVFGCKDQRVTESREAVVKNLLFTLMLMFSIFSLCSCSNL